MPRVPRHPVLLGLVLAAWVALIVTAAWLTRT